MDPMEREIAAARAEQARVEQVDAVVLEQVSNPIRYQWEDKIEKEIHRVFVDFAITREVPEPLVFNLARVCSRALPVESILAAAVVEVERNLARKHPQLFDEDAAVKLRNERVTEQAKAIGQQAQIDSLKQKVSRLENELESVKKAASKPGAASNGGPSNVPKASQSGPAPSSGNRREDGAAGMAPAESRASTNVGASSNDAPRNARPQESQAREESRVQANSGEGNEWQQRDRRGRPSAAPVAPVVPEKRVLARAPIKPVHKFSLKVFPLKDAEKTEALTGSKLRDIMASSYEEICSDNGGEEKLQPNELFVVMSQDAYGGGVVSFASEEVCADMLYLKHQWLPTGWGCRPYRSEEKQREFLQRKRKAVAEAKKKEGQQRPSRPNSPTFQNGSASH